jgi:hypothetical protein
MENYMSSTCAASVKGKVGSDEFALWSPWDIHYRMSGENHQGSLITP